MGIATPEEDFIFITYSSRWENSKKVAEADGKEENMQKDFHYYCIAVLAKTAGFEKRDALTIAYASQYVDDSTESEPIQVGELMFDPVRTAHLGLKAFNWAIQKRVYIPFHFIPPNPIRSPRDTFVTAANSPFARRILKEACEEQLEMRRLIRIGVALHTLADMSAHQGFSGRQHSENDVESIYHREGKRWKPLPWENFYLDFLPQIGHAEAGYFPDCPFLTWKYTRKSTNEEVERNNTQEFLTAAKSIHQKLSKIDKSKSDSPIPWGDIETGIRDLLAHREKDIEKRCGKWTERFQYMFDPLNFAYDSRAWRNDALGPDDEADTDWDNFEPSDFRRLQFPMKPGFYNSLWVQFHRAALRQRHLVLESLL